MHIAATKDVVDFASLGDTAPITDPRRMTPAQLRRLGVPRLVYLRCGTVDGQEAFAIHAADGTPIAVVEDIELAMELAAANHMAFVAVH